MSFLVPKCHSLLTFVRCTSIKVICFFICEETENGFVLFVLFIEELVSLKTVGSG